MCVYIYKFIYTDFWFEYVSCAITNNAVLYSALFVSILALWPTAQLATAEGTFATYAEALLEGDSLGAMVIDDISMIYRNCKHTNLYLISINLGRL